VAATILSTRVLKIEGIDTLQENKKPTDCLLGACSGRQSVGYRFSLLTLLFSGVIDLI
jgi:hypothetical protein